jgi:hypothetical protein
MNELNENLKVNETEVKNNGKRLRVANIMQYEEFLTEDKIKSVLSSYKTIEKYAYIKHDKDKNIVEKWRIDDTRNTENPIQQSEELKKPHWHIVIQFKTPQFLNLVSKWFGISENYVDIPKGRDSFIQCVKYLTHEGEKQQKEGKFHYQDNEVISNFNFREEIEKYEEKKLNSSLKGQGKKESIRKKVMFEGLKLSQIDIDDYVADFATLQKCRLEYLKRFAELPKTRINFYITGGSGTGKSLSSRALAKTLVDPQNTLKDNEVFFVVGQSGSLFEGYDGQPVLVWDDLRAMDLLKHFNKNVGAIFNLFDVIPSESQQNVKFSSVKLINSINIVNSVQAFQEFCDTICYKNELGGIYEAPKQIFRRFPFFIELSANQKYDFFVNSQFFNEDEGNYKAYIQHKNLGIGLKKISTAYKDNEAKRVELTNKHFEKITEEHKKAVNKYEVVENVEDLQQQLELEISENENKTIEVVDYVMQDNQKINHNDNSAVDWSKQENKNLKNW